MNCDNLFESFKYISNYLKFTTDNSNDILKKTCDEFIISEIANMNVSGYINSNSLDPVIFYPKVTSENLFLISFLSLDGIKNIKSNISVGTIYCIYKYNSITHELKEIINSGYCLYGTKTILVQSDGNSCSQYILNKMGSFVFDKNLNILNKNNNLYAINLSKNYDKDINVLIKSFNRNKYNQRWIGSMVGDCHHILTNGGIFMYPMCDQYPNGKLNYFVQVLPLCFIFQGSGGIGIVANKKPILDNFKSFDLNKNNCKFLSDIILCNKNEYKNILEILDIEDNIRC
jgi:fructose-1,6-bisphosphatase